MMRKMLLLGGALFAVAMNVSADEPIDTLKLQELQEVQVISTRANKKTPVAYSDMNKAELKEINYGKDIPQLLNITPSVTTSSDAGMGVGYTGIHVRGTDPTRINITVNGIPINDAQSAQTYWVNMGDFASSVESMQVQRGVGTSTNGAAAFGATVNMQTENIGMKPYLGVDLSGGSYGTHKETVRFSTGMMKEHWGIQGRVSNIGSDGYIDRASSRLWSYFLQGGYFDEKTVLKFITFNGWEKTYMAWDYASREQLNTLGRTYNPSGEYTDANGNTAYYKNQTDNYQQQHYHLVLNQILNNYLTLNATLHYTHGFGYYQQYKSDQKLYKYHLEELGKKSDLVRQKRMQNDFMGAVASLNYNNRRGLTMNVGGAYSYFDANHYGRVKWLRVLNNGQDPTDDTENLFHKYYDNGAMKKDGNIYGKVNYEFMPGLSAYLDLQYRYVRYKMTGMSQEFDDNHNQRPLDANVKYHFFNPKFGLTYQFAPNHTAYASYAIAHKEPTRNDFEDMLSEAEEVNPVAERLNDLEVGYQYTGSNFSAGVNFYWMVYENQFVLTGAQDSNGEMVARNIKDSYRMGVEVTAGWRPFKGFRWDASATWSKNRAKNMELTIIDPITWEMSKENVGETNLAFSPDWIVNNAVSYEYKGLKATVTNKFVSEQYMTNSNFRTFIDDDNGGQEVSAMIDDFFTTDIDLSYSFKVKGLKNITIGATVYNLFSTKYENNGACGLNFRKNASGQVEAFSNHELGFWAYSVYSAQAPRHFLAHLSVTL